MRIDLIPLYKDEEISPKISQPSESLSLDLQPHYFQHWLSLGNCGKVEWMRGHLHTKRRLFLSLPLEGLSRAPSSTAEHLTTVTRNSQFTMASQSCQSVKYDPLFRSKSVFLSTASPLPCHASPSSLSLTSPSVLLLTWCNKYNQDLAIFLECCSRNCTRLIVRMYVSIAHFTCHAGATQF